MKPQLPHLEKGYYESLIIVLDTLEKCLSLQAQATHAHHRGNAARGDESGLSTTASAVVAPCRETGTTSKHDEVMNVKLLLKEICQFLDMPNDNSNMVNQIRSLTSKVLYALSVNNFSAVFSRISSRLQELSVCNEENPDHVDIGKATFWFKISPLGGASWRLFRFKQSSISASDFTPLSPCKV